MRFVKSEDLKAGMRLARPIYNKNGVLLYERNSKLTMQGINSVKNFGLLGIFILEPAEPVPPMTRADVEFERFQTMCVFSIREELDSIVDTGRAQRIQMIASNIIKNYGHLDARINFMQNLRSKEDYIYKHSLNVAILCAMITHVMNIRVEEQMETVQAALVHDIGKIMRFEEEEAAGGPLIDMTTDSRVEALIKSINILVPGVSVELNTGEKALVLAANEADVLRPMVLMFKDNTIIDLADMDLYEDLEIKDIMKTLDNRHVMDMDLLKRNGIELEEAEYVEIPII